MTQQRPIDLNPRASDMEVAKISYPAMHSRRRDWSIEPMRFIPHSGRASA